MGSITASAIVDENRIVSVDLDLSGETESIGQQAGDTLVHKILDALGTEIDGISGAAITSNTMKGTVQAALDQTSGIAASAGAIPDRTHTGTAHGSRSEITIQVTVKDNAAAGIHVTDEADSPYFSNASFNAIP
ncbi:MAG: FMN-binding protein [Bulleidia sp.]